MHIGRPPFWASVIVFMAVPALLMSLKSVIPFWLRMGIFVLWSFFMVWIFIGAMEGKDS